MPTIMYFFFRDCAGYHEMPDRGGEAEWRIKFNSPYPALDIPSLVNKIAAFERERPLTLVGRNVVRWQPFLVNAYPL